LGAHAGAGSCWPCGGQAGHTAHTGALGSFVRRWRLCAIAPAAQHGSGRVYAHAHRAGYGLAVSFIGFSRQDPVSPGLHEPGARLAGCGIQPGDNGSLYRAPIFWRKRLGGSLYSGSSYVRGLVGVTPVPAPCAAAPRNRNNTKLCGQCAARAGAGGAQQAAVVYRLLPRIFFRHHNGSGQLAFRDAGRQRQFWGRCRQQQRRSLGLVDKPCAAGGYNGADCRR